jgi:TonB-dependent receptor
MKNSVSRTRARALATVSLGALAGLAAFTGANAQDAAKGDGDVVVVTGYRQAYTNAVKTKRDSIEITDSISSDGLGRFPDLNVGEAVQRIPGVQINREADSRNATISLRGLPGTFARTTLNGGAFADPILSSATNTASTPLGAFNSDIFSSITVVKSPDASDIAGGLSGNIDLRIAPALSRKQGGFFKVSEEYDTLGSLTSPQVSFGYNKKLSSNFAVFGVAAYKDEKFRRDSISVQTWANKIGSIQIGNQKTILSGTTYVAGNNPAYDALQAALPASYTALFPTGLAPVYYPSQVRHFSRFNKGHLLSTATGFEWKPSDELKIGATAFYTERYLDEGTNDLQYIQTDSGQGVNTALTATSQVTHITSVGTPYIVNTPAGPKAYINTFTAENNNTYDSTRSEPAKQSTWSVNPSFEFKNDAWKLNGSVTVSRAVVLANQIELDVIQNPAKNGVATVLGTVNGNSTSIFTGGTELSDAVYTSVTPTTSHVATGGYPTASAASQATQAGDAANVNKFGATGSNGQANNFLNAAQFDAERYFKAGIFTSLQFGVRLEQDKYVSTGSRNTSLGALTQNVTAAMVHAEPANSDFFGGQAPGINTNWNQADVAAILAAITPINAAALPAQFKLDPTTGVFITPYGLVNNYWDPNYWNNNFTNTSDIHSFYAMAKFNTHVLSVPVRGNVGARYESTANTITALDCVNCSSTLATATFPVPNHSLTTRTYSQNYHYLLPSLLVAADLRDDLVLRFASYSTYVRPQPRDTVPISSVLAPEPNSAAIPAVYAPNPTYTATLGATNLKPYRADSMDMSLEWYNRPGGLLAIDVFQKKIKGYIGPITDTSVLCPADGKLNGVDYGLGPLAVATSGTNAGKCLTAATFNTTAGAQQAVVSISGQTNLLPMTVNGIELVLQQNLDFLPGFWKNFGGAFNYGYTTVSGKDASGNPITLPSVAKDNVNLIGYYETKKFGIRLVYNYRGKYDLAAGNTFVGDARSVKARSQLDASASYNINDRISVSVDAFNLTDATRAEYENDPSLPRRIDYDGKTYQVTLNAKF